MADNPEDRVIQEQSERFLFAEFEVGGAVEDFLRGSVGRYMQGVAEQEIGDAVRQFLDHDLSRNHDLVARAQLRARNARQSFIWMLQAIEAGHAAEHQLREMDDMERD